MLISHNTTNAGDGKESEHKNFYKDAKRLLLDVSIKIDSDEKENGGDDHDMGRRE